MARYGYNSIDLMQYEYEINLFNYENDYYVGFDPKNTDLNNLFAGDPNVKDDDDFEVISFVLYAPKGKIEEALYEICKKNPTQRNASFLCNVELTAEELSMFQSLLDKELSKVNELEQQEER